LSFISESDVFLRILENDLLIKHDSIWPHGLSFSLQISSLLEVSEFRQSCIRHRWPPEKADPGTSSELDIVGLRSAVTSSSSRTLSIPVGGGPSGVVGNGGKLAAQKERSGGAAAGKYLLFIIIDYWEKKILANKSKNHFFNQSSLQNAPDFNNY